MSETPEPSVLIRLAHCSLRAWRTSDVPSLVHHANDRMVWRNLRDRFPHPYTLEDATSWIAETRAAVPPTDLAIDVEGAAVGAVGVMLQKDVFRQTAEIGYWLGREHWGRGLGTEVVRAASAWAFASFDLCRLEAGVFEWNPGSMRVLEKAGYTRESVRRRAVTKDGQTIDEMVYVLLR